LIAASRLLRLDVDANLRAGGRGVAGDRAKHLSAALVVVQLALSVVVVTGAIAMFRTFLRLHDADLGATTQDVVTGLISLPPDRYRDASERVSFFARLTSSLQREPGVQAVTISSTPPASGGPRVAYEVGGEPSSDARQRPTTLLVTVGTSYFHTFRTPMRSGLEFTDRDDAAAVSVAVVNEQFARMHWPAEDPMGKRLRVYFGDAPTAWLTVVGVSANIVQDVNRQQQDPIVYMSYRQRPTDSMWVFARTHTTPDSLAPAFRRDVTAIDRALPIWIGPYALRQRLDGTGTYWNTRTEAALLLLSALIALLLAAIGLYAVIAHTVARRTREIGVRVAIGATRREIVSLMVAQAGRPVALGAALGLPASAGTNRMLQSQFVNASANDALTYVATALVLVLFAAVGCAVPTFRATRIDPVVALRSE
jgi:predicted permease